MDHTRNHGNVICSLVYKRLFCTCFEMLVLNMDQKRLHTLLLYIPTRGKNRIKNNYIFRSVYRYNFTDYPTHRKSEISITLSFIVNISFIRRRKKLPLRFNFLLKLVKLDNRLFSRIQQK